MICRAPSKPKCSGSSVAVSIICRDRSRRPISPSCVGWTNYTWSFRSRAAGCCGSSQPGGDRHRPPACLDLDEADGHRGALPQAEHLEASAGAQDLPVSATRDDDRPSQPGLAMDITYVPMARGFVYLAAVVDWFSRRVLS